MKAKSRSHFIKKLFRNSLFHINLILLLFLFTSLPFGVFSQKQNWIAIYVWDSFAPLTLDRTVPEMLISLEVIFQQHAMYAAKYDMKKKKSPYGSRSTEGHFMVWMHFEDDFFERNGIKRSDFDEKLYLFPDRETDIFTAWCGQANFRDFILDGVSGLANQTIFNDGSVSGELDHFQTAINMGNASYGAGYYLEENQVLGALDAIMKYPGFKLGYSFASRLNDRPELVPYEAAGTEGVNGFNCNDFAFYLLEHAGVLSKDQTEQLKVEFWYPEKYWNHTIPLKGSGAKIYEAFNQHRNTYMGRDEILKLAWTELFFSGLNIFDEKALIAETKALLPNFKKVRVWNQLGMINYLKDPANRDFEAKYIREELTVAAKAGSPILVPFPETPQLYDFTDSKPYLKYQKGSERRTRKKMRQAGLTGEFLETYRKLEESLKNP